MRIVFPGGEEREEMDWVRRRVRGGRSGDETGVPDVLGVVRGGVVRGGGGELGVGGGGEGGGRRGGEGVFVGLVCRGRDSGGGVGC